VFAGNGTRREGTSTLIPGEQKLQPNAATIAYCRIGERSSHTWFTLKYLLGFPNIRNYDGSWTEWGNLVNVLSNGETPGAARYVAQQTE
jgi:thiosulfate/3-mercaptopyruvate sulfurtransferase